MAFGLAGCGSAQSPDNATNVNSSSASNQPVNTSASVPKAAVVCFSATGNTWAVAQLLSEVAEADLIRIQAAEPYTQDDLNYNVDCRANAEQEAGNVRPQIAGQIPDMGTYDTVYLGFPIWWGKAPRIMLTLLEGVDLAGKRVVPFCTSGGSDIVGALGELKSARPSAQWESGKRFAAGASKDEIQTLVG